jgi:predicted dehydrogenase
MAYSRFVLFLALALPCAAQIKLGIVGTDTSHVPAFTSVLNDPSNPNYIPGARVVAAYKGGSADLESSATRVDKYADEIKTKYGVEIVPDIATLLTKVDAVLLESVDGRIHLAQFREIAKGGKPVFIDKPLSSNIRDAREIARLAKQMNVKWFSSSSLRYGPGIDALKQPGLKGVIVWGPGPTEEHHELELTWYGIHAVEILYTLMGTGCEQVTMTSSQESDVITGRWKDGRLGTIRVNRPYSDFGAAVITPKTVLAKTGKEFSTGYFGLIKEFVKFFQTGVSPVPESETLELFEFMEAARQSKLKGGVPVAIR